MLTTKKTFQTKFLSTLLILALVSTMILAPTALAAGFGGSSITTAVADSGARNFTPTEAANDTEIQAMTDNSSVLNESDIIYMILTDRFYDADPTNNGTLNQEYRPGQLKYTQGGDWKGITQKLDYIKNLGVTAIWISPPSQNELLSRDGEESGYHGYFTHDYNSADPHFGTKQDLIDLVEKLNATSKSSFTLPKSGIIGKNTGITRNDKNIKANTPVANVVKNEVEVVEPKPFASSYNVSYVRPFYL